MPNPNSLVVCTNLQLYAETDKAILVGKPGLTTNRGSEHGRVWLPSSLIEWNEFTTIGDIGDLEIPRWLAEKNDLEYEDD